MIDHVLHLFGERERERLAFDVLVAQILAQSLLGQIFEQLPSTGFDLSPPRTQRRYVSEVIGRPDARMLTSLSSLSHIHSPPAM